MTICIVTNNPGVAEITIPLNWIMDFNDCPAQHSLLHARDLLLNGWQLAADPLAGYRRRFNPYHTVFLIENKGQVNGYDILRLERAARHIESTKRPIVENTKKIRNDYRLLDLSLSLSTLKQISGYCRD